MNRKFMNFAVGNLFLSKFAKFVFVNSLECMKMLIFLRYVKIRSSYRSQHRARKMYSP